MSQRMGYWILYWRNGQSLVDSATDLLEESPVSVEQCAG